MATTIISAAVRQVVVGASEARTETFTSDSYTKQGWQSRGLHLVIDVTAITDTPILTPAIQGQDTASGEWYDVLVGSAISATGTSVLKVYPGIEPVANGAASDVLPPIWRVVVTATDADRATYSVGANLLP